MKTARVKNVSKTAIGVPNGSGGTVVIAPGEETEIPEKYMPLLAGQVVKVKKKTGGNQSKEGEKK